MTRYSTRTNSSHTPYHAHTPARHTHAMHTHEPRTNRTRKITKLLFHVGSLIHINYIQVSINCPSCSALTLVPRDVSDVKDFLKPNYDLRDICAAKLKDMPQLQNHTHPKISVSSTVCSNDCTNVATHHCTTCGIDVCSSCFDSIHSIAVFRKHAKVSIDEAPERFPTCPKHNNEQELYCTTCQKMICFACSHGEHQQPTHKSVMLVDALESFREELTSGVSEFEESEAKLLSSISAVENMIKQVKQVRNTNNRSCASV